MSKTEETTSEQLAAKLETGEPLTTLDRKKAANLLRNLARPNAGRPKKFSTKQERWDFHNAERAKKRKADKEEI
ncbi:MAG: hypothetical protein ACR2LT_09080 [Pyrinomonadaceae bacterium]